MKNLQNLTRDLQTDLMSCATDPYGPLAPQWERRVFSHGGLFPGGGIVITTGWSRDPSRSCNGGEYYDYARYRFCDGGISREETSSCEIDERVPKSEIYNVALSQGGLERLAELAAKRVSAQLAPKPIDLKKFRRRIEDALRKTATSDDLIAIAGLLGVKTE
ncbi:hypothetical protein KJ590_03495 [Patescibacteria group bacterium]|nr:hypothetical protein [Patescibacteria group bacterium]